MTSSKTSSESSEKNVNSGERKMSFGDHLRELQGRLMITIISVVAFTIASFFFHKPIFEFLRGPMDSINAHYHEDEEWIKLKEKEKMNPDQKVIEMISVGPTHTFATIMWLALVAGLVVSSPVWMYEAYSFISPGLKKKELRAIQPIFFFGIFCFLGGVAFNWFFVFPYAYGFLIWFDLSLGVIPRHTPDLYISLLLTMSVVFGVVFEAPLVASVLARLGLLKPWMLKTYWRMVVLACFVLGAALSPGGDPITMLILSGVLLALYGVSIVLTQFFSAKHAEAKAKAEAGE